MKIERKLSNEHREKMAVVSTNRDLRKELDEKRNECRRLEQQVTEALAVMPIQSFMAEGSGDVSRECFAGRAHGYFCVCVCVGVLVWVCGS